MKEINKKYISSRITPVLKIIKLFEDAPVYDLSEIVERTGFTESTVRTLASRLALPSLNVRRRRKTYFFLTEDYLKTQFMPTIQEIASWQVWGAIKCGETFPIDVFVESCPSGSPNYLIIHDFTVSQVLTSLNSSIYKKENVRFSPASVHFITPKGNVEPDIVSVFEPSEDRADLIPVIFEIVQTPHGTKNYFYYLFLKYNDIANANSKLFANIIINDDVEKDIDKYIEKISRKFVKSFKDKDPEVLKKKIALVLRSGGLVVYIWKLSTVLSDPMFDATVQSQVKVMLHQGLFIKPDMISIPKQHIGRVELEI